MQGNGEGPAECSKDGQGPQIHWFMDGNWETGVCSVWIGAAFNPMKGNLKDEAKFFLRAAACVTSSNGHKLQHGIFRLCIRKNFFALIKH